MVCVYVYVCVCVHACVDVFVRASAQVWCPKAVPLSNRAPLPPHRSLTLQNGALGKVRSGPEVHVAARVAHFGDRPQLFHAEVIPIGNVQHDHCRLDDEPLARQVIRLRLLRPRPRRSCGNGKQSQQHRKRDRG